MPFNVAFLECGKIPPSPSLCLNELCEYNLRHGSSNETNLSFGWLLQICLENIPFFSPFLTLLRDLQDTYQPLQVRLKVI